MEGKQTWSNEMQTGLTVSSTSSVVTRLNCPQALNVVLRMKPRMELGYSYNRDSFFTADGCEKILHGLEIWRGYFQSLRAGQGRMYLNLDISTAMMYQSGPLINLCLKFFGRESSNPNILAPNSGFDQRRNRELTAFLAGIVVASQTQAGPKVTFRVDGLSARAANQETFSTQTNGQTTTLTVATYFANTNRPLQYPNIVCVKVSPCCLWHTFKANTMVTLVVEQNWAYSS